MSSPWFANKTFIIGGAVFFGLWVLVPLLLNLVFRMLNTHGGNIDLLLGLTQLVSVAGLVFGLAFFAAVFFRKTWVLAAPLAVWMAYSLYGSLFWRSTTKTTVFVSEDSPDHDPAKKYATGSGASMEGVLLFAIPHMSKLSADAVGNFIVTRQAELARHLAADATLSEQALYATALLEHPEPSVVAAVQKHGEALMQQLRRFNEQNIASDCKYLGAHYRDHFLAWITAWQSIHRRAGLAGGPPLQSILELAAARSRECPAIEEIRVAAQAALKGIEPAAAK